MTAIAQAQPVQTAAFQLAQTKLALTIAKNGIAALSGESGCGKTFAITEFLHSPAMRDRQYTWLDMPPNPAPREVVYRTLTTITGSSPRARTTLMQLTDELAGLLTGSGRVLIIDEAHNLRSEGLKQLRYLHQRGDASFSMILAGSDLIGSLQIVPELRTRVTSMIRFKPLTGDELLPALAAWHPLLNASSPKLLRRVDTDWAHGNFRLWAMFLAAVVDIAENRNATTLTDKLVAAGLVAVGANDWLLQ